MNRRDLVELVSVSEWPCVSLVVPLEHSSPENQQNELRVKSLMKRVKEKLAGEGIEHGEARPVLDRLEGLLEGVDLFSYPDLGLALFASPSFGRRLELPFPVRERVAVDRVFATRDILVALERGVRWRAVVLGSDRVRVLDGFREKLVEVTPSATDTSDSTDGALAPLMAEDSLPLIVVGFEAEILAFLKHSKFAHEVIVTSHGRHDRTKPRELGLHLWPIMKEAVEARRNSRLDRELDAAFKHGRLLSGIEEVWNAAHQGRGDILLVEEDLHFPVEKGLGPRTLLRAPEGLEIDNAIDEIVDVVLQLGGRVHFVSKGSLREHDGIALVTRYAQVREVA